MSINENYKNNTKTWALRKDVPVQKMILKAPSTKHLFYLFTQFYIHFTIFLQYRAPIRSDVMHFSKWHDCVSLQGRQWKTHPRIARENRSKR